MTDGKQRFDSIEEKAATKCSGWFMLILNILLCIGAFFLALYGIAAGSVALVVIGFTYAFLVGPILFGGLKVVKPNEALVLTLFGRYNGTIREDGFFFVNPFSSAVNPTAPVSASAAAAQALVNASGIQAGGTSQQQLQAVAAQGKKISMKAMTLDNKKQKVNDLLGNPIEVGIVVIWRVNNTAKAVFNVDNFMTFISVQADSALRDVARQYPYDINDNGENENEKSLRSSSSEVAAKLREDLQARVGIAGLEVMDARITHLAYAPEIAAAMLQRQQASAIIAARQKIVEGAVGMVEMALDMLNEKEVCTLDEERKAQMVSNLLVVLCGSKDAQPIVNSGSIY